MKMNFRKKFAKVTALAMAVAMLVSLVPADSVAAKKAKKPKLVKSVKVTVKKTKKIKIKNTKKIKKTKWSIKSKKIAAISKKKKTSVVVKGKKAGKSTTLTAKVTLKGKKKTLKLKCKVKVIKMDEKISKPTDKSTPKPTQKITPKPTNNTDRVAVKVYTDAVKDENLVAEVRGVGFTPTPVPKKPTTEVTPEPTPGVIIDVNAEDDETGVIAKRGDAQVAVVDGGANGTEKAIKVTDRTADWNGAEVNVTKLLETGNKYEISFYAKQTTGEASKIDLSCQYTPEGDDAAATQYEGIKTFDLPNDEWTKCEVTFKIPAHVGDISIYWQSVYNSNNFMDFYLDEFTVKGVAKSASDEESTPDLSTGLVKDKVGNPIMTSRLTADPWAMEYNGRVYVYGTNDSQQYAERPDADNNYAKINTLNCYSSADMANWTDHGTIAVAGSKGAAKWAGNSWAPAVCHKKINGKEKFFLYFANSANSIGVLTADSPTGPWTDPIGKALIDREIPGCEEESIGWLFDPAVLVDDDGTGYLYFGGIGDVSNCTDEDFIRNPNCARVVKLGDDMVSVVGEAKSINAPFMFEDSGINKIGDKYYYSYCTNWTGSIKNDKGETVTIDRADCPAANIAVMESDSPMGEFKYVGCVMKNPGNYFGSGVTGNNHHCFTEFKGQMYAFYHTKRDTMKVGTKADFRTSYVNKLNLGEKNNFTNNDGSIADTPLSVAGVQSIGTLNPYTTVEAETFAIANMVGTVLNNEANTNKDWLTNYSVYNGKPGGYIGVADVEFGTDGASKIVMKLSDTSLSTYKELSAQLRKKITGKHTIYFVFEQCGVQMDSWSFKK